MDWTEVTIFTTTAGIDMVTGLLDDLNIQGYALEDAADFEEFLQETTPHWDYVEESLLSLREAETRVIVYLPKNAQGAEMLSAITAMLRQLKESDPEGKMGRLETAGDTLLEEDWENNWKQY